MLYCVVQMPAYPHAVHMQLELVYLYSYRWKLNKEYFVINYGNLLLMIYTRHESVTHNIVVYSRFITWSTLSCALLS